VSGRAKLYLRRLRTRSDLKVTSLKLTVKAVVGGSAAVAFGFVGGEWNGGGEEGRRPRSCLIGGGGGGSSRAKAIRSRGDI
jgi:hypothetical protein